MGQGLQYDSVVDRIKILCMSKPTCSCLLVGSSNRLQREFMHLQWREKLLQSSSLGAIWGEMGDLMLSNLKEGHCTSCHAPRV